MKNLVVYNRENSRTNEQVRISQERLNMELFNILFIILWSAVFISADSVPTENQETAENSTKLIEVMLIADQEYFELIGQDHQKLLAHFRKMVEISDGVSLKNSQMLFRDAAFPYFHRFLNPSKLKLNYWR